jgi:hypothetical protein
MAFSLFIGVGVPEMLTRLLGKISTDANAPISLPTPIHTGP